MSLKIILRPVRNFEFEIKAWLTDCENTVALLEKLKSVMFSLESLEADREVMNMTLQLMATDFSSIAEKLKDTTEFDEPLQDIRNLLHRTSDMIDGVIAIGVKVNEARQKIMAAGNTLASTLVARKPNN